MYIWILLELDSWENLTLWSLDQVETLCLWLFFPPIYIHSRFFTLFYFNWSHSFTQKLISVSVFWIKLSQNAPFRRWCCWNSVWRKWGHSITKRFLIASILLKCLKPCQCPKSLLCKRWGFIFNVEIYVFLPFFFLRCCLFFPPTASARDVNERRLDGKVIAHICRLKLISVVSSQMALALEVCNCNVKHFNLYCCI